MDFETLNLINLLISRPIVFLFDALIVLDATQRQVLYRLDKINYYLESSRQPIITLGENKEFQIHESTRIHLFDYLYSQNQMSEYNMNRQERKKYIYLMMFINQEYLSLQHFLQTLKVSRSTLLQDIRELSESLTEDNIKVVNDRTNGYFLEGKERLIRKHMMNIILDFVGVHHNYRVLNLFLYNHQLETIDYMKILIDKLSIKYGIVFVEDRLYEFMYIFIMIKNRIMYLKSDQNLYYDIPKIELMNTFKEYDFTKELLSNFFKEDLDYFEVDIQYLTSWIIGVSVGDILEDSADLLFIGELVGKIIKRFELVSGVKFDDAETIYRHIYSHFRPAYYRLLFKHPILNPLSDKVVSEYNELYKLVYETMRPISKILESKIPQEELAYLTLHFLPAYKTVKKLKRIRLKALIICLNGVGSSAILYNELSDMFPDFEFFKPLEVSKVDFNKYDPDIVFTTHYFKELIESETPIVKVSPVMDALAKSQIIQEANLRLGLEKSEIVYLEGIMNAIRSHFTTIEDETQLKNEILNVLQFSQKSHYNIKDQNMLRLSDLIKSDFILFDIEARDWKEAIVKSGQPLIEHSIVSTSYIEHIVNMHESEVNNFVIVPNVAMPHTISERGSLKHGISIGVLKEPIVFGCDPKNEVKYIFVLSSPDNHRHLNAMGEFLSLLSDKEFFKNLDHKNIENVLDAIGERKMVVEK